MISCSTAGAELSEIAVLHRGTAKPDPRLEKRMQQGTCSGLHSEVALALQRWRCWQKEGCSTPATFPLPRKERLGSLLTAQVGPALRPALALSEASGNPSGNTWVLRLRSDSLARARPVQVKGLGRRTGVKFDQVPLARNYGDTFSRYLLFFCMGWCFIEVGPTSRAGYQ